MKWLTVILAAVILLMLGVAAFAHGGRTNQYGIHTNRTTGEIHAHNSVISKDNIFDYFDYTEYEVMTVHALFGAIHKVHSEDQFCYVYFSPVPSTPYSSATFELDSIGICREKVKPFTFQDLLDGGRRLPPPSTTPRAVDEDVFKLLRERAGVSNDI